MWKPKGIPDEATLSQLVVSRSPDIVHVEATWEWDIGGEGVKSFEGVIISMNPGRIYWGAKYGESGENDQPYCFSYDTITGIPLKADDEYRTVGKGERFGGECALCPQAEWGSGDESRNSQACTEHRKLYVLRSGEIIPIIVTIPPASLRNFSAFLLNSLNHGGALFRTVTSFSLETEESGGVKYSQVVLETKERLPEAMSGKIAAYARQFLGVVKRGDREPYEI